MDQQVLHALNGLMTQHQDLRSFVVAYVVAAPYLICALVAAMFLLGKRPSRRGAVTAGLSAVAAVAIAQIVTAVVDRARPFVADPLVHVFVHHGPDRSFPSDSATAAFAIAVALLAYKPRLGWVALALAVAMGIGRIAAGMHYPTDILAGVVLGAGVAMVLRARTPRAAIERLADALARAIPFSDDSVWPSLRR
jgi:undecaprenyl-diphosphatase